MEIGSDGSWAIMHIGGIIEVESDGSLDPAGRRKPISVQADGFLEHQISGGVQATVDASGE